MTIKIFNYLICIIIVCAIYTLFAIKDLVSNLDYQLSNLVKQIALEKNQIHILKAEYAFLISPNRLKKLALKYLDLNDISLNQITVDPLITVDKKNFQQCYQIVQYNSSKINRKWRYKSNYNNHFVKRVSAKN